MPPAAVRDDAGTLRVKKNLSFGGTEARQTSMAPTNDVMPVKKARYADV